MPRPLVIVLLLGALAACHSGSALPPAAPSPVDTKPTTPFMPGDLHFAASPMDIGAIQTITALGAMAPWGHTLPTDHVYIVHHEDLPTPYPPVAVYAPGAGTIERIDGGRFNIRVNATFQYYIAPLTPAEGIAVGMSVSAGTLLGYHSTFPACDFAVLRSTLRIAFANPARYGPDTYTSDGPMQYFDEPIRSALEAKVRRIGSDKQGQLTYDVVGLPSLVPAAAAGEAPRTFSSRAELYVR